MPADRLIEATWPDGDVPDGATRSMRTYVSRLRMVLPGASITTRHGGYVLDVNGASVDLDEFDSLLDGAEVSVPDRAVDRYDRALQLWRGEPFGEFAGRVVGPAGSLHGCGSAGSPPRSLAPRQE